MKDTETTATIREKVCLYQLRVRPTEYTKKQQNRITRVIKKVLEEDYDKLPSPLPPNDPLPDWTEGLDQDAYQAICGLHQSAHHMDTDEPVLKIPDDELNEYKCKYNKFVQKATTSIGQ